MARDVADRRLAMMTSLASEARRDESTTVPNKLRTYYVYLCNGEIRTVSSATSLTCGPTDVVISDGDHAVASFHRPEVYFASHERISPPILF